MDNSITTMIFVQFYIKPMVFKIIMGIINEYHLWKVAVKIYYTHIIKVNYSTEEKHSAIILCFMIHLIE